MADINVKPIKKERYYVYLLKSLKDNGWYIGFTTDLKKRLIEHARGREKSTKFRRPFKLIHYEYFVNSADARLREIFLKSGFGREQLKSILKNTIESI